MGAYEAERAELLERFAASFRELREADFPSQEAFAQAAKLHRTHVGYLEQGRREPSLSTLLILAQTLEVPVERLFEGLAVPRERRPTRELSRPAPPARSRSTNQ
jgi:transcriptional regulator with XRE-family HTH domain